jgi:fumarate reductase subunit C
MLKIGAILIAIGLFIISPLDEIFILLPLSAIVGVWVFPVAIFIGLMCLIIGALLTGKNFIPLLKNPIVLLFVIIAIIISLHIMELI